MAWRVWAVGFFMFCFCFCCYWFVRRNAALAPVARLYWSGEMLKVGLGSGGCRPVLLWCREFVNRSLRKWECKLKDELCWARIVWIVWEMLPSKVMRRRVAPINEWERQRPRRRILSDGGDDWGGFRVGDIILQTHTDFSFLWIPLIHFSVLKFLDMFFSVIRLRREK